MRLDDVQIEGIIAWTNDPFIRGPHETAHIAKCLPDTIRALATEVLESRAFIVAKDARIAELEAALTALEKASASFHSHTDAHFSDTNFDSDHGLAMAEATLAVDALPRARAALGRDAT